MQQQLATERGIEASVGTIWTFLDRCGLTFKKSPRTQWNGIGPTSLKQSEAWFEDQLEPLRRLG